MTPWFERHVRNALAHGTYKPGILKRTVTFIDRKHRATYNFEEVQRMTRELSALLLVFPQLILLIVSRCMMEIKKKSIASIGRSTE